MAQATCNAGGAEDSSPSSHSFDDAVTLASFASDSAMMIAYERSLESEREGGGLFTDPFARQLAGEKGEQLSQSFEAGGVYFGFAEWPAFHKTWTVVRTKFIDDLLGELAVVGAGAAGAGRLQMVNCGAGLDTRACRLECYRHFARAFEVDLPATIAPKEKFFRQIGALPLCENAAVAADLLDAAQLAGCLAAAGYDPAVPAAFLAEGLIMYLQDKGPDFVAAVSASAAAGSTFILNFMGRAEDAAALPGTTSQTEMREMLEAGGWGDIRFHSFGDEVLNYGRYPAEFPPCPAFSFVVCTKR